ncbi:MAG: peptide ABC transporter substrate-binding protein, partial [Pseudomonadales bacterium]|nr:peptide ABC transporter substrate-binding protein [Pseudomonadales bacterium]
MRRFLATSLLLLVALTNGESTHASAVDFEDQTVTIALTQEPPQLNSMKATDQVSILVLGHVMEGLTRYDRRGNIQPGVAERWEIDDKGATFWIRDDAHWSDGVPVTAHDFVFAWRNGLDPATASEYAFILYAVKNGEAINKGELPVTELGATAIDAKTLRVEFERPVPYFLKLAAFVSYAPVREDFFESRGERYAADASDLLYNGPFKITEWVHGASLRMEKNEHYWDRESITLNAIDAD